MSDGSGVDFGMPRSKPLTQQGRDNWDRINWKDDEESDCFGGLKAEYSAEVEFTSKGKKITNEKIVIFNPQAHEQMK